MSEVGYKETGVYGFKLIGYLATIIVLSGVISGIGSLISSPHPARTAVGGLFGLFGILTLLAGLFSLLYKVIVDATSRDN